MRRTRLLCLVLFCAAVLAGGTCSPLLHLCRAGVLQEPTCTDQVQNGDETDVDCGGPACDPCSNDKLCRIDRDCNSGFCNSGTCATPVRCWGGALHVLRGCCCLGAGITACPSPVLQLPSCDNGLKDGDETDIDCGGDRCPSCNDGKQCSVASDCKSQNCEGGVCAAQRPTCTDTVQNGDETDVDWQVGWGG